MMRPDHAASVWGSARTLRIVGLVLGFAIMGGSTFALLEDHESRLDGARRQSLAAAASVDRLLKYELRNLERAMTGVIADADTFLRATPDQAPDLLADAIAGVLARQQELESLALYDAQGRARAGGGADPPEWTASSPRGARPLLFGPLQRTDRGWVVPMALRTDRGDWLVARLRTSEIQRMITGLNVGRDDRIVVLDRHGSVLAHSGASAAYVSRRMRLPELGAGTVTSRRVSELDGIERMATFSSTSGYPLVIVAGIGLREARAHWLEHAAAVAAVVVLYWLGLLYLVRRLEAHEAIRGSMLEELQASAEWLRQAQLASRTGVWRLEPEENQVHVSAQAAELFGFEPKATTLPVQRFFDRMHREDRVRVEAEFVEARQQRAPFRSEYRIVLADGRIRWIKARGAPVTDVHGVERTTGTIVDITERREATDRIERAESQFRALFERNPLPFWVFDAETLRFLAVNDAAIRSYGYSREEFLAMTILDIRPDEETDDLLGSIPKLPQDNLGDRVWTHQTRDGRRFEVRVYSSSIEFAGRPARLVLAEDVSEDLAHERDLAWRASHDTTTGMLNVETLVQRIDALAEAGAEADAGYVIAYVRLRELELVAPTLGRHASETILLAAAERFEEVGHAYGYAAYLPAESFVIVALDAARRSEMLDSLLRATEAPVEAGKAMHLLEASIGLADGPVAGGGAEQVIGNAALAALQARREGAAVMRFDATMAARASERLELAARLRLALDKREFELHFQPIRRLADDQVVSLEALLRWRGPDGRFVPPSQFIPLCEESGLIVPLGEWVLEEAARCHALLASQGHVDVSIAVNVSAVQFLSESLPATLRGLRQAYALPRGALQIELTESAVLRKPEAAHTAMQELRGEGVCISIDDFGTGFSSMAYLKSLPLDFLKIDRAFVADVHQDPRDAAICSALITLGHGLGLQVIAEGVSGKEQLEWLRTHGCDQAQGYFLGKPAPLAEVLGSMGRWAA
jgi:PAS domain S-box-containing protein